MDGKKIGAVVIVAIIVVGVGLFLKAKFGKSTGRQGTDKMVEMVDVETGDVISRSMAEWDDLGKKDGKFKNPDSKKYTMVAGIICASCGARVPAVDLPPSPKRVVDPNVRPDPREFDRAVSQYNFDCEEAKVNYMCPKCGDPAYRLGPGGNY